MNFSELIKKHERQIEILEAIQQFERKRKAKIENIEGFGGQHFPSLKKKWENDVDTINMAIKRLYKKYEQL